MSTGGRPAKRTDENKTREKLAKATLQRSAAGPVAVVEKVEEQCYRTARVSAGDERQRGHAARNEDGEPAAKRMKTSSSSPASDSVTSSQLAHVELCFT